MAWLRCPAPKHLLHLKQGTPSSTAYLPIQPEHPGSWKGKLPAWRGSVSGEIPVTSTLLCRFWSQHFLALFFPRWKPQGPQLNLFHAVTLINVPNSGTWGLRGVSVCVCGLYVTFISPNFRNDVRVYFTWAKLFQPQKPLGFLEVIKNPVLTPHV